MAEASWSRMAVIASSIFTSFLGRKHGERKSIFLSHFHPAIFDVECNFLGVLSFD